MKGISRGDDMANLEHSLKKEETVKWFLLGVLPIVNIYFLWKIAEVLSGHSKSENKLIHKEEKSSIKWFFLILLPPILTLGLVLLLSVQGGIQFYLGTIITLVIDIYILWRVLELISGHEKTDSSFGTIDHKKTVQTVTWVVYLIVPLLNLYVVWRLSEIIAYHAKITNEKEIAQEPKK